MIYVIFTLDIFSFARLEQRKSMKWYSTGDGEYYKSHAEKRNKYERKK